MNKTSNLIIQVRELMTTNKMPVIIFAIDDGMKEIYNELSQFIQVNFAYL
jgi:hypothetical protein